MEGVRVGGGEQLKKDKALVRMEGTIRGSKGDVLQGRWRSSSSVKFVPPSWPEANRAWQYYSRKSVTNSVRLRAQDDPESWSVGDKTLGFTIRRSGNPS